jgi:hypothetical protein
MAAPTRQVRAAGLLSSPLRECVVVAAAAAAGSPRPAGARSRLDTMAAPTRQVRSENLSLSDRTGAAGAAAIWANSIWPRAAIG